MPPLKANVCGVLSKLMVAPPFPMKNDPFTNALKNPADGDVVGAVNVDSNEKTPVPGFRKQKPPTPEQLVLLKLMVPSETVCGVVSAVQLKVCPANETPAPLSLFVVAVQLYDPKQPCVLPDTATCACETPATPATITAAVVTFLKNPMYAPDCTWRSTAVYLRRCSTFVARIQQFDVSSNTFDAGS